MATDQGHSTGRKRMDVVMLGEWRVKAGPLPSLSSGIVTSSTSSLEEVE